MLRLVNALWLLVLVSLILIAVYVSLGRHFLSVATETPSYLEEALEQVLDQAVEIKSVQGHWHFLSPSIALREVSIGGVAQASDTMQQTGALQVGFLQVGVDVFRTLVAREPRLSFLHVSGLKLAIYAANGRIDRIEGLNPFGPSQANKAAKSAVESSTVPKPNPLLTQVPRLLQHLLADKGLILKEIQLNLHTPRQSQKFLAKQLSLVEVAEQYHIQAELELLEGRPVTMALHSIMGGQLMRPETWSGRFFLDLDRTPAAPWLNQLPKLPGQLDSLDVGGALWGNFEGANLEQLTGEVSIYALDYWLPKAVDDSQAEASDAALDTAKTNNPEGSDPGVKKPDGKKADQDVVALKEYSVGEQARLQIPFATTQFNWQGQVGGQWQMRWQETTVQGLKAEMKPGPLYFGRTVLPVPEVSAVSSGPATEDREASTMGSVQYSVQGQAIPIGPMLALIESANVVSGKVGELLREADANGSLEQLTLKISPPTQDQPLKWSAGAVLKDLQWAAAAPLPGVSGLSLAVFADQAGGALQLDMIDGALDIRPNFRQIIPLTAFSASFLWELQPDEILVRSGVALLENEDALGTALMSLQIPKGQPGEDKPPPPNLSLIAGLTDGSDKVVVGRYLPTKTMAPNLVRWLDKSLLAGVLESGHFVYEGPLAKGPYAEKTFQMRFVVDDATVDYQPPWPALTQARVDAFINKREAQLFVPTAKAYDADVSRGKVDLPYFERGEIPYLDISLAAEGDIDQGLRVLRESPLRAQVGDVIEDVVAEGQMDVALSLTVPLGPPKPSASKRVTLSTQAVAPPVPVAAAVPSVKPADRASQKTSQPAKVMADVLVTFEEIDLSVAPWQLSVDSINGPLRYKSGEGLTSTGMTAQFLDRPISAELFTLADRENKQGKTAAGTVKLVVAGRAAAATLAAWRQLPILSFLSGETDYKATVAIYPKSFARAPSLTVETDLVGMTVDLPAPVSKAPTSAAPLTVFFDFGEPRQVSFYSESAGSMGLSFEKSLLSAVHIDLGARELVLPQNPGLVITGETPALFLAPWIEFIEQYQARAAEFTTESTVAESAAADLAAEPEGFDWLSELRWADLSAEEVGYKKGLVSQARIQVARVADVWRITVQSAEASGIVSLPLQYFEEDFLARLKTGRTSAQVRERMNAQPIDLDIGFLVLPEANQSEPLGLPAYLAGPPQATAGVSLPVFDNPDLINLETTNSEFIIQQSRNSEPTAELSNDAVASDKRVDGEMVFNTTQIEQPQAVFMEDGYRRLPPFNARVRRVFRSGKSLGAWSVATQVTPLGLTFQSITGNVFDIAFEGRGAWTASLGGPATVLTGQARSQNLSATFEQLGFAPSINSEDAALGLALNWRGRPWDFDMLTANGQLNMAVRDGTLLNVNATASTVKVIGLLNIEMLTRRMQLDFSDVVNKGIQFSLLDGEFDLREGVLLTDHIKFRGPSTQFDMSGQVSLRAKTLDTEMSVTLPVTRNLVLPAAATGGLPAAATAYVIEKALGDALDKLTTMRFKVQGDWDDPQITRKRRPSGPRDGRSGRKTP